MQAQVKEEPQSGGGRLDPIVAVGRGLTKLCLELSGGRTPAGLASAALPLAGSPERFARVGSAVRMGLDVGPLEASGDPALVQYSDFLTAWAMRMVEYWSRSDDEAVGFLMACFAPNCSP